MIAYLPFDWIVDEYSGDVSLPARFWRRVGYPKPKMSNNSAANLRVRDRIYWSREAWSQPIRWPSAEGEFQIISYPQKPTEYASVFIIRVLRWVSLNLYAHFVVGVYYGE
jgi:hypothetical protein